MDLASLLPHIDVGGMVLPEQDMEVLQQERIEAARQEQEQITRAAVEAEYEARIAELTAAHEQALQSAHVEWSEGEAPQLAAALAHQVEQVASSLAEAITRIMAPFVGGLLPKAAISSLHDKILQAASHDVKVAIRVDGPSELAECVRKALTEAGFTSVEAGPEDGPLQARIGDSVLISRLPEWLAALAEPHHG